MQTHEKEGKNFIVVSLQNDPLKLTWRSLQEFGGVKDKLIAQLETIMKAHPAFSTPMIARKCFTTKAKSNDYHAGDPDIPTTLKSLSERISKKVETLDHFRYLAEAMVERLTEYLKPDMSAEIKTVGEKLKKMISAVEKKVEKSAPAETKIETKPAPKRGSRGQQKSSEDSNKENDEVEVKETKAPPAKKGRGGRAQQQQQPPKEEPVEAPAPTPAPKPTRKTTRKTRQTEDIKEEVKSEPLTAVNEDKKEIKMDVGTPPAKGKRKATAKAKGNEAKKLKLDEKATAVQIKPGTLVPAGTAIKVPVGSPTGKGVVGVVTLPNTPLQLSPKTITSEGGNKVVNIASLLPTAPNPRMQAGAAAVRPGQQLIQIRPSNVQIRPQAPGSGNIVQMRPPVSIRPSTTVNNMVAAAATPGGPQFFKIVGGKPIQLSGISGASGATSTTAAVLAGTTTTSAPPGALASPTQATGPRIVYVRKPTPTSILSTSTTGSSVITAAAGGQVVSPASPSKVGSKIIFVSNKNQLPAGAAASGVLTAKPGQPLAPGVVKLVSGPGAAGGTAGNLPPGILSTLRPVAVNSNASAANSANARGPPPMLLRTVMPKPPTVFQKSGTGGAAASAGNANVVPQLPNVPIPKSKLNDTQMKNSSSTTSGTSAGATAVLDPKMQAMLPKRPIPPQKVTLASPPPKIIKKVISSSQLNPPTLIMPSNMLPGNANLSPTKQAITTISGPFVWENSSQSNFKLSSRINFASFAKFKEMSDAGSKPEKNKKKKGKNAANDEGIHFTLAKIVTDDDSNEFTFRLNLKNEPNDPSKSFLELEARSRKPHNDHKWNLKVKTNPPNILVSGGCFASDSKANKSSGGATAFRIPKQISDLKSPVDYDLQIDKVVVLPQMPLPNLAAIQPKTGVTAKGKK